jgi:hypothetical protein
VRMTRCCCAPCSTGAARFRVFGCTPAGGPPIQVAGADVVITLSGSPIATVTSSATVRASTGAILSPGIYDYSVAWNRYDTSTGSFTIGPTCPTVDVDILLAAPDGMVCCPNLGGKLVPDTLFVTDENGTWTLVYNPVLSRWLACGEHAGFSTHRWQLIGGVATCGNETADVPYALTIACAATGGSNFRVGWLTVQPCAGTDWTAAAGVCDSAALTTQPAFDADGAANPAHYQAGGGFGFGSVDLGAIPIVGTIAHLSSVADGGGHAGVAANAPVFGPFAIAE